MTDDTSERINQLVAACKESMVETIEARKLAQEAFDSVQSVERTVAGLVTAITGGLSGQVIRRLDNLEKRPAFPWLTIIRMTMASVITLASMAAVVRVPNIPDSISYVMYAGVAFLFGDSIFTMIKKKL